MPTPPSTGPVTSPYGPRSLNVPGVGPFHYGEDRVGDGNYFPEAGTIVFALYSGVFGNIIGVRAGNVVWNLAHHEHLNGRARGQVGAERDFLAPQGATGLVTGRHVHTERRVDGGDSIQSGTHTNPADYYTSAAGGGGTPLPNHQEKPMSQNVIKVAVDSGPAVNSQYILPAPQHFIDITGKEQFFVDGVNKILDGFASTSGSLVQVNISGQQLAGGVLDAFKPRPVEAAVTVDHAAIAREIAAELRPEFAAVQANIDDSPADELANKIKS